MKLSHFSLFVLLALILFANSCDPDSLCGEGMVAPNSADTSVPQLEWWVTDFVMTPSGPISALTIYSDGAEVHVSPESEVTVQLVARDEESGIASMSLQGGFSWTCDQGGGALIIVDGIIPLEEQNFGVSPCAAIEQKLSVELVQPDCGDDTLAGAGYGLTGSATNGTGLTADASLTVVVDP